MGLFDLKSVNPLERDNWNDQIRIETGGSIFHSREWAEVLTRTFKYQPHYLMARQPAGLFSLFPFMEVRGLFNGTSGVCLPFSDIVDPILPEGDDPLPLLQRAIEYAKRRNWKYIDFHGGEKYFDNAIPSRVFYGHRLELDSGTDRTFEAFSRSAKRTIRKTIKMGVKCHLNNSPEWLDPFYRLHCLTRKRHKLPAQPYLFFRNIHEQIIAKGMGNILFASHQGKILAAMIFFHFGNQAFWKFGVSDLNYKHLNPNNLLVWEAVKWYSNHQYRGIGFGRTDISNAGLRQFKQRWGTVEYPLKYFRYDIKNEGFVKVDTNRLTTLIRMVFKWLPIRFSKIISKGIYRYFG